MGGVVSGPLLALLQDSGAWQPAAQQAHTAHRFAKPDTMPGGNICAARPTSLTGDKTFRLLRVSGLSSACQKTPVFLENSPLEL